MNDGFEAAWKAQWLAIQAEFDRRDIACGHSFECSTLVLGNGSAEQPMLAPVGVDRYGRMWVQRDGKYALVFDPASPLAVPLAELVLAGL